MEAITLITHGHVPDEPYEAAKQQFTDEELVNLTWAAIAINGWNRVAIAFRSIAGEYQPAARKIGASDEETSAHIVSRVQPVPRVQPADCTGCKGHFADVKTVARYSG